MEKSNRRSIVQIISGRHIFTVLISLFVIIGIIATYRLVSIQRNYSTAQDEYDELRQFSPIRMSSPDWIESVPGFSVLDPDSEDKLEQELEQEQDLDTMPDLSDINRDYIGWIRIEDTSIDYPVVQGSDNIKYLSTTFRSERNPSGTIFMDAGCSPGFSGFSLLHGHNMRDGSMFADLNTFPGLLTLYPDITIFTKDGELLNFTIFDVKRTDNSNAIFSLSGQSNTAIANYFSAYGITTQDLEDGMNILVLATCTSGGRDERLLVFAKHNDIH